MTCNTLDCKVHAHNTLIKIAQVDFMHENVISLEFVILYFSIQS